MSIDEEEDNELSHEEIRKSYDTVKKQVDNPTIVDPSRHVKKSDVWHATQLLSKIQRQLIEGYTFDIPIMTALVNKMFSFINGIAKPDGEDIAADVKVEEIAK